MKIAEMTEKNLNLLTLLGERLEANEKEQFRFKMVVVNQLSRIEAIAEIIKYSIPVGFHWKYPEKLDELVQEKCNEISGRMLNRLMGVTSKTGYGRARRTAGITKNVNEPTHVK